ncbi:4Fe-4S dicluster domain-containing protein [Pyrococcus abyssi]|uniref:Fe-S cluster-containing hydrogenase component, putative n=1 Tax=Pyrococcus abyssi (strain GE5 / Orsay) TaxID=272844 RepID=Q9V1W3_PYRAB|nr:4Fe-4S dicluster domain-containing protein [Pyrococcus abyssi]CAB49235.1 Fe-S cluster-containing hydrogenase component, putative [Pyrococcus abyssi GE5]CCE69690.1 TPA: polyferredoxin related [Pyrococcus abyssi GE5]
MSEIPNYLRKGYITPDELFSIIPKPSEERLRQRPVAVPECPQRIPCTPCKEICPTGAIKMENPNDIPIVDYEKCIGCSLCVQVCPGLAFFMIQYIGDKARITLPHELLPLPRRGEEVVLLNRIGEEVGKGRVIAVVPRERTKGDTPIVTVEVPIELAWDVRAIKVVRE